MANQEGPGGKGARAGLGQDQRSAGAKQDQLTREQAERNRAFGAESGNEFDDRDEGSYRMSDSGGDARSAGLDLEEDEMNADDALEPFDEEDTVAGAHEDGGLDEADEGGYTAGPEAGEDTGSSANEDDEWEADTNKYTAPAGRGGLSQRADGAGPEMGSSSDNDDGDRPNDTERWGQQRRSRLEE